MCIRDRAGAEVGAATTSTLSVGTQTEVQLYVRDPLSCFPGKDIHYATIETKADPKVLEAELRLEGFVPQPKLTKLVHYCAKRIAKKGVATVEDLDLPYTTWYTHYLYSNVQAKLLTKQNKSLVWIYRNPPLDERSEGYNVFQGNKRKIAQVSEGDSTSTCTDSDDESMPASDNENIAEAPHSPAITEWYSPVEVLPGHE